MANIMVSIAPITLSQRKLTMSILYTYNTIISVIIAAKKTAFPLMNLMKIAIKKIPRMVP